MATTDEFNPVALRVMRERAGLSQAKLAKKAGLPRPSVTNYEAGKRTPMRKNVARLALALDFPMMAFYKRANHDA